MKYKHSSSIFTNLWKDTNKIEISFYNDLYTLTYSLLLQTDTEFEERGNINKKIFMKSRCTFQGPY